MGDLTLGYLPAWNSVEFLGIFDQNQHSLNLFPNFYQIRKHKSVAHDQLCFGKKGGNATNCQLLECNSFLILYNVNRIPLHFRLNENLR